MYFHISDQTFFMQKKKSIGDKVHIWLLKTAYTILLSNETLDQSISCLYDILLASEWDLPPSFSHIFSFRTKHFCSRKKLHWRYGPLMVFKNCLYHSFFKRNLWSINIISLQDFISISVSPSPPLIFAHFHVSDQTFFMQKKNPLEIRCIYGF